MAMFVRDRHSKWAKAGGYLYTRFIFFGPEVWEPATYQFKAWFDGDYYDGSKMMTEAEFERLQQRQRKVPKLLCCHARRVYYWWFADDVWTTHARYTDAEAVKQILLHQGESRFREGDQARSQRDHRRAKSEANPPRLSARIDSWEVLEVPRGSSEEVIKEAYRKQLLLYHPDKVSHLGAELQALANEKTKAINQAYEELMKHA